MNAVKESGSKAVLLNVWATWCIPCREEFPDLIRLKRNYQSKGLELILVSTDFEGNLGEAQGFLRAQGVDFSSFIKRDKDQAFIEALSAEWSGALPATFLYNKRGQQVHFWEGKAGYADFEARVLEVLGEVPGSAKPSVIN